MLVSVFQSNIRRVVVNMPKLSIPALVALGLLVAAQGCRQESSSQERTGLIQRKGVPMTLLGPELKVGQKAPAFTAVNALDMNLKKRSLSEFKDKFVIISSVPSLDTPVCNEQTIKLNAKASELAPDVVILTLSLDVPYAMKRWSNEHQATDTILLSDYRNREFGKAYGLIIKERMLLARAVMIIDRQGAIQYLQIVKEQFSQPDYEALYTALQKLQQKK